ncbi:MAG: molecular chaperone DnaJ [Hyphomicrobiales bacterium]
MSKRDFYEVLGVERSVDEKELKSAYRKLAKKYHPDANAGDDSAEAKFKEVSAAYDTLKDPQKRAAYDRFGHAAFENGGPGAGGAGFGPDFSSSMSDIFEDLFGEFMGGGGAAGGRQRGGGSSASRGSDLRYNMEIDLADAYLGKTAEIRVPTSVACDVCSGSGAKPGSSPTTCATCGGHGQVRAQQGFFTIQRTCPSCHGEGQTISDPCADCSGQGRITKNRTLSVNIPAGVEDGTRIRLAGKGEAGMRGGPAGDLYIFISIASHEFFQRDGSDLFCRVPIAMTSAAVGGEIEVPTIDGKKARVNIPEGTQTGKQFRLRGKGMPVLRAKQFGDLYIQTTVETPVNLSKRQRELLEEFNAENRNNSPQSEGFFAKAKAFWEGLGE